MHTQHYNAVYALSLIQVTDRINSCRAGAGQEEVPRLAREPAEPPVRVPATWGEPLKWPPEWTPPKLWNKGQEPTRKKVAHSNAVLGSGISPNTAFLPATVGLSRATMVDEYCLNYKADQDEDYEAEKKARGDSESSEEIGVVPHDPSKWVDSESD